ncbi:MAG: hypothetical protein LUP94_00490, partial [Candidatus Methanomethylicus sp.]|nr:hypothetical protein [Candidatus Methanomethylicus sp.]
SDLITNYGTTTFNKTSSLLKNGVGVFSMGTGNFIDMQYGTNVSAKVLTGPIPFDITSDYQFVKVYDGASTLVAVSAQIIHILPALSLTPTSGPGGQLLVLSGTAILPNQLLNITYTSPGGLVDAGQVTTDVNGKFTFTWNVEDLANDYTSLTDEIIDITPIYNNTGVAVDTISYDEYSRTFDLVGTVIGPLGNNTITVDVYVHQDLIVVGSFFNPTDVVTLQIDGVTVGTATVAQLTGLFNTTITIPEIAIGLHTVDCLNAGVDYAFAINVLPTLEVIPSSGPIGTVIEFKAYGFPADQMAYIYWLDQPDLVTYIWTNIVNGTVGSDGKFNVTVTWTVEHKYGGSHNIVAADLYDGPISTDSTPLDTIATTAFTVTPQLWVDPNPIDNNCTIFQVYGNGFVPNTPYYVDVDNNAFNPLTVSANSTGDMNIGMVAAGFRPGTHEVTVYPFSLSTFTIGNMTIALGSVGSLQPEAFACFNVTTIGDPIAGMLISIDGSFATIASSVGTIQASLNDLNAKIVAINGSVVTIESSMGTLQTSLASINTAVTSIQGTEATISTDLGIVKGKVTSIEGTVATIQTNLGTVQTDLATVKTNTNAIKGYLPIDMTPVWITLVVALIAAIAAIFAVISIRSKIAA